MIPEEDGCASFVDLAGCDHQDELDDFRLLGLDAQVVEIQKQIGRSEGCSLIAIHERMILGDAEKIGSGQFAEIGITISLLLQRSGERRFKHAFIAYTGSAAVEAELFGMKGFNEFSGVELGHLARAR
jgi:hypothetical protein